MSNNQPGILQRPGFEAFILQLPATTLVRQWGDHSVAKVGGKVFAIFDPDPGEVWFKVSDMAFELLTELEGVRPAPYFARAVWVAVGVDSALSEAEIKTYMVEAHRLIASKLTKKLQAELDLTALIAATPQRF